MPEKARVLAAVSDDHAVEMKTVSYRGGVLRFRIPASWREEYEDQGGGMFYEDVPDSGTLRVKVITLRTPSESDCSALSIFDDLRSSTGTERGDVVVLGPNAYVRFEDSALESGMPLKIFYWLFVNPVPPSDARVVTYSYTVLEALGDTEKTRREVSLLHEELVKTEFADRIAQVSP